MGSHASLLHQTLFFLAGAVLLCLAVTTQNFISHVSAPLSSLLIPALAGGIGGLYLAHRNLRIATLEHQINQANILIDRLHGESEGRYRQLFEKSQTVQLLIDPEAGSIIEANVAARQFYGYSTEQLAAMTIFDLNIEPLETTRTNMERALSMEQLCFHFQHRLQSGEVVPVAVYTVPLPLQGRTLLHSVVIDLSIQDRAETHLRRKTLEQRLLLDAIPVGVWYLKDPETYGSVNRAFAEHFDLTPLTVAHHRLETVLNPDMLALALASNRQVFQEKKALHYEQWVRFGGNEPRYMAITKTPKLDDQDQVEFVVCTATDITGMQQARELLRIERDLHVALTAAHSLEETLELCLTKAIEISRADCGGLYQIHPDDGSLHLLVHQGLPPDFITAATAYSADSSHARLIQANHPIYTTFDAVSHRINNAHLHQEGLKAIAIIPISFEEKVIACLNIASHDVKDIDAFSRVALERIMAHLGTFLVQKEQAALVLQSQRNLDALFNTIQDMVFILDMEGRILHLNATALARLGYSAPELIGQSVLTIHPPKLHQQAVEILAGMIAGKQNFCPLPLITKHGVEIPVETHLTLGQWSGSNVLFGLSRDIGERLQLEHQQRLLLKNEGMERMAGAIAHHFNNLMAIVAGNVELAREETDRTTEAYRFLNNALDGSKRAIDLGKSLLIYTGHFAEETESLDLAVLCRHHLGELAASLPATISLTVEYPQSGPIVPANPQQFDRVLSALMTNSVEGIGQRPGQISVRISSVSAGQISTAHLFPAGWKPDHERYGRLEIADTGAGIDEQQMASIFDPFYSEKFIGRGLGLPLALSIVKKLGGAITVQSQQNKGTVFQVLLPEARSHQIGSPL